MPHPYSPSSFDLLPVPLDCVESRAMLKGAIPEEKKPPLENRTTLKEQHSRPKGRNMQARPARARRASTRLGDYRLEGRDRDHLPLGKGKWSPPLP